MSTFSGLNIAASGLTAARLALEVTGQNVSNANTEGYTRQRVVQSPMAQTQLATYATQSSVGDGVLVTGVARLNDAVADARVRSTAATSAYWSTTASAVGSVETSLNEPSKSGLSSVLNGFWNSWQTMSNAVGSTSSAGAASTLLAQGRLVASTLSAGYTAAADAWTSARSGAAATATTINDTAAQVADLNRSIRALTAAGSNVNALLDQRDAAVTKLAQLTGATQRSNPDGTVDVTVGGNLLVSGTTTRKVELTGDVSFTTASTTPVSLQWSDTKTPVSLDGGEMAARLAALQPANADGTGGVYAEAAKAYDDIATAIATAVNTVSATGNTAKGVPAGDFFAFTSATGPAATNLVVKAATADDIAVADPAKGNADGSIADAISQLGAKADSPDAKWSAYVSRIGSQSATATARSSTADTAAAAATDAQTSAGGVDLDEETANLIVYQHAYQAAARVISTIDGILDTLMNMGAR
jgi:flagellar hook-associated protein 1 FlgK